MINRRRFLAGTALASAAVVAVDRRASAFSLEDPGVALTGQYLAAKATACGGAPRADHAKLLADLKSVLDGSNADDATRRKAYAQAVCPICGCPLAAS